jgi:hypothetical protein
MYFRYPHLRKPSHRVAVELDLVDRLVGPRSSQFRGAVGGDHDKRHGVVARLDDGGKEVRGCRARRACEQRRPARPTGESECKEGRGALVDGDVKVEALLGCQSQRQWGRARTRSEHGMGHAVAHELVHESHGKCL